MKIHEHGGIDVDEYSRSSVPNIYAVGDVTNRVNLTPVAIREGHAFADTVYGGKPTPVDHANVPTAVFSEPEVGVIGLTEDAGARATRHRRHLQDQFPADEGDAVRPQYALIHEAAGRRRIPTAWSAAISSGPTRAS